MEPTIIVTFLTSLFQAVPTLKKTWDDIVAAYVNSQIESMTAENLAAIRKAIDEKDQRDLEKALKSPRAGAPSDIPGVSHVSELPNVLPVGAKPPAS